MSFVSGNKLNRLWKNHIKPIKDAVSGKLDSSKIVNSLLTTKEGFALDARQGKALDDKIIALNSKLIFDSSEKSFTNNGWAVKYRNAGAGYLYVDISRTVQKLDNGSNYTEITNLLFTVAFKQALVITNLVGYAIVGNGSASFNNNTMICNYEAYAAPVSNHIRGLLRVV